MSLSSHAPGANLPRPKVDPILAEIIELKAANATKRTKAAIYRPGQAPAVGDDDDDDVEGGLVKITRRLDIKARLTRLKVQPTSIEKVKTESSTGRQRVAPQVIVGATSTTGSSSSTGRVKFEAKVVVTERDDRKKPASSGSGSGSSSNSSNSSDAYEALNSVRVKADAIDASKLVAQTAEVAEDDDEVTSRRARALARRRAAEDEEKEKVADDNDDKKVKDDDDGEEEESSSSDEEEDDDDIYGASSRPMLKPIFVSKKQRETLDERKRIEDEEIALEKAKQSRLKERRVESRQLVEVQIKQEDDERKRAEEAGVEVLPNDDDDITDIVQLEQWKLRELARIKRDTNEREKFVREAAEVARRRTMTDAEIKAENEKNGITGDKDKGQFKFLQKYYHPGAFFQDDENDIYKRDFTAPTGADKEIDRQMLPKVLQVKKFGMKGRTKYTHLVDQDTTNYVVNPWTLAEATAGGGVRVAPGPAPGSAPGTKPPPVTELARDPTGGRGSGFIYSSVMGVGGLKVANESVGMGGAQQAGTMKIRQLAGTGNVSGADAARKKHKQG